MTLIRYLWKWDAAELRPVTNLVWHVRGNGWNPNRIDSIVAATELDALEIAHREDLYIESVVVRDNFNNLIEKMRKQYEEILRHV